MPKQPERFKVLTPTHKGFNYEFRMLLEGVQVPFRSANVMCTPNGVEASINVPYHHSVYDLKPKTAVQIFYREWWGKRPEWKVMFDGFFSRYDTNIDVTAKRGVSITCRDFRMDMRKAPAALALEPTDPGKALGIRATFTKAGCWQTTSIPGVKGKIGVRKFTLKDQGLNPIQHIIEMIAGTAAGQTAVKKAGELTYTENWSEDEVNKWSIDGLNKQYGPEDTIDRTRRGSTAKAADGAFFLDGFARGLWTEAVGAINIVSFLNKRIRVDKRLMVVPNMSGFNMFAYNNFGITSGPQILGNSTFSSIEAIIMRVAGLFMSHVYSCATPSLISLADDSPAIKKVMHESVRNFLVTRNSAEFGPAFMLNETMLLPPLHFTAPPNCNIFLPPMYNSIRYQYDHDVDYTRGYFRISEALSTKSSAQLDLGSIQVPTALFSTDMNEKSDKNKNQTKNPNITIEERYKGVNLLQGNVNQGMANSDITHSMIETYYKPEKVKELRERIAKLSDDIDKNAVGKFSNEAFKDALIKMNVPESRADDMVKAIEDKSAQRRLRKGTPKNESTVQKAMQKHALLKFLNARFIGRVANIDMAFNPFVMGGFPGLIVTDSDERLEAGKPIIGFVQQVKHFIVITSDGGEASTSVVLSNVRHIDESTDFNPKGMPLYMPPTNKDAALLNENLEYASPDNHFPPVGSPHDDFDDDADSPYDVKEAEETGAIYARDVVTLSKKAIEDAQLTRIYLDQDYAPTHITRYYRDVFSQKHHLMVGNTSFLGKPAKFMYDTVHEAVMELMRTRPDLLTSYEACLEYVQRNVCSAEAFYLGILGLSVKNEITFSDTGKKETWFQNRDSGFDGTRLDEEYFGVTTGKFNLETLKKDDKRFGPSGTIKRPGDFSSVRESSPLTAFISERKKAVKEYLFNINRIGTAMQFADERV